MVLPPLAPETEEETTEEVEVMTNDAHRDIALLILNRSGATEADLLRAVCHAVLAGYRPPLSVDAFNPPTTEENQP